MSGDHAFLAPSFAPVWGRCSAAPAMAAMFPQEETEDTREGDAAHWYAVSMLRRSNPGGVAPNGVIITDDMRDGAMEYVNNVEGTIRKYQQEGLSTTLLTEFRVHSKMIHEHNWGTLDAAVWVPQAGLVILWDFKYGHREVEVFEHFQLIDYMPGLLDHLCINGKTEADITAEFRIVQPRCFTASDTVRSWQVPVVELRGYWNHLHMQAADAMKPNPVAVSGTHCRDCPARHACPVARNAAMASVDYSGKAIPEPLTPEAVSFELNALTRAEEAIKARKSGLEEQAKAMIKRGTLIPGYGLVPAVGRLAWNQPPEVIDMLGSSYGISLRKPAAFITPVQAKDMGIDEFVINAYAQRPSNGLKLVKQDEKAIRKIITSSKN